MESTPHFDLPIESINMVVPFANMKVTNFPKPLPEEYFHEAFAKKLESQKVQLQKYALLIIQID